MLSPTITEFEFCGLAFMASLGKVHVTLTPCFSAEGGVCP